MIIAWIVFSVLIFLLFKQPSEIQVFYNNHTKIEREVKVNYNTRERAKEKYEKTISKHELSVLKNRCMKANFVYMSEWQELLDCNDPKNYILFSEKNQKIDANKESVSINDSKYKQKLSDKKLEGLRSDFAIRVRAFMDEVSDKVFITDWFRSQEEQNELYKQWRTAPGKIVTWTTDSNHAKGLAVDIAFYWEELYPTDHNRWEAIAKVARRHWLVWGYDLWGKDKPHFQVSTYEIEQSRKKVIEAIEKYSLNM